MVVGMIFVIFRLGNDDEGGVSRHNWSLPLGVGFAHYEIVINILWTIIRGLGAYMTIDMTSNW